MQNLVQVFILNIIFNSVLSFIAVTLLFGSIIWALKLRTGRLLYFLTLFPVFKLLFDLFLYQPLNWALFNGLNPLTALTDSRTLTVGLWYPGDVFPLLGTGIQMALSDGKIFTPADIFALWIGSVPLFVLISLVVSFSVVVWGVFGWRLFHQWQKLRNTVQSAVPSSRSITNSLLKKYPVHIVVHPEVSQPFACGIFRKRIVLPQIFVETAPQNIYEATIAHEIEHLRWNDLLLKMILNTICVLFWWVPTRFWMRKIECIQEKECDRGVSRYNIEKKEMASAIFYSAKYRFEQNQLVCSLTQSNFLANRVETLLTKKQRYSTLFRFFQYCVGVICMGTLLFAKFWIF